MAVTGWLNPTTITIVSNSGDTFTNKDNALTEDAAVATSAMLALETTEYLVATGFDFSTVPAGAVITKVEAQCKRRQTGVGPIASEHGAFFYNVNSVADIASSSRDATTGITGTLAFTAYTATGSDFPSSGKSKAALLTSTFGFGVQAVADIAAVNYLVDVIQVRVTYVLAGPGVLNILGAL